MTSPLISAGPFLGITQPGATVRLPPVDDLRFPNRASHLGKVSDIAGRVGPENYQVGGHSLLHPALARRLEESGRIRGE